MRKSIVNKGEITPACKYCAHGIVTADKENVLCVKTGIRLLDSSCNSFKYDPLKRVPVRRIPTAKFTEDDFKL